MQLVLLALILAAAATAATAAPLAGYEPDPTWKPTVNSTSGIKGVSSCAVGASSVYVGQRGAGFPVLVLDGTGKVLRGFGKKGVNVKNMHGMHVQHFNSKEYLWLTDSAGSRVEKWDAATGKLLATVGTKGTGAAVGAAPQFGSVADVAFDAAGAVYVSDGDGGPDARVMKLDGKTFRIVWVVGNNGTSAALRKVKFSSPHSLDYDVVGHRIFVADRNDNQLLAFDAATGAPVTGAWNEVFTTANCPKPSVWSVRCDPTSKQTFVALSNFGSGSKCPNVKAADHKGRIAVVATPAAGGIGKGAVSCYVAIAHGFPHEICVDARSGAVFSSAVDTADLPAGAGLGALTKYVRK